MTFVMPHYRLNKKAMKRVVDGVEFLSYSIGILSYALISTDGRAKVTVNHTKVTYSAAIERPDGTPDLLRNAVGDPIRFRSEVAAMKAAIKALASQKGNALAAARTQGSE